MKEQEKKLQTMKQSPVLTGLSFLHATLLLDPVPALLYGVIGAGKEELARQYWFGGLLILPVILSWLAVRCCQALWLYVLTGIAAAVLASFTVPMAVGKLTAGGLTALLWMIRGGARIRKGRIRKERMEMPVGENAVQLPELSEIPTFLDEPRAVHFLFFAVCYLLSLPLGEESLYRYIFGLLFVDILVCFLYRYLAGFREYVKEHQSIANLPVHTMKKIIYLLLLPALLILLLVMIPSLLYGDEPLTRVHINLSSESSASVQITQSSVQENDMTREFLSQLSGKETAEMPAWIEILLQLLAWCVLTAAAFLMLRAMYRAIRSMNRSFLKEEDDEITFLGEEDQRKERKRKQSQGTSRLFLTPGEQIRKKYKKTLRRAMLRRRKMAKGTETPAELELSALGENPSNTDMKTLHTFYEKARYSSDDCTSEEARRVSSLKI